jgi:hypothetical protein
LAAEVDTAFDQFWNTIVSNDTTINITNYGPLYASLPVHRVTLLREPFSWLNSKFAWHKIGKSGEIRCDDVEQAVQHRWAREYLLDHLMHLCGVDCINRWDKDNSTMTLQQVEEQAAYNLRHSFSVVGVLTEVESFYEMISTRMAYLNTSRNSHVQGGRHSSRKTDEILRCTERFQQEDFRETFGVNSRKWKFWNAYISWALE